MQVFPPCRTGFAVSCLLALTAPAAPAARAGQTGPLETVVVTGAREEPEEERVLTPGHVTTVNGDEQFRRMVTNLADLMRHVPGVYIVSNSGADDLFLSSRGSNLDATSYDNNGIKLLQDGLPVTAADGNNHNRMLDPLAARFATFAHGANALTHGASTLGGAIDFTSPTARTTDPLALFASGGSFGQLAARLTGGFANETLDALATYDHQSRDGYRDHNRQERSGLYANAGYQWSASLTTRLHASWIDSRQQLPGSLTRAEFDADPRQANPSALSGNFRKNVETVRLALKTTWTPNAASTLDAGVSWESQSLFHPIVDRIMVDFDGPGPAPPVEVFSLLVDTDQDTAGASLRYSVEAGGHALLFGANYGHSTNEGGNYRNLDGQPNGLREYVDNSAASLELFAMDRWRLSPSWTLVYGAQYVDADRNVKTTSAVTGAVRNPRASYSSLNPRLGLLYATGTRGEIYANTSRVFEPPTNYELEDDVRGSGATLAAMHGTSYEIGWRGHAGSTGAIRWSWDVAAYYAVIRDEILSVDDPAAPGTSLATNIDRTTHAGIEGLVSASLPLGAGAHRIEPLLSLTLNEFRFDTDATWGDNRLPAAPRYLMRGEVMYSRGAFRIGPTFELVGGRFADFANSYALGSHGLLGLRGSYTAERWEGFAEIRNLLDRRHVATVGVLNEAAADARVLNPGAPLSGYAGVRLKL